MFFNFFVFRRRREPVVRCPLSSVAVVVCPPCVVASSAACLPCVIGYRPLEQQPPTSSLCPPPPPTLFSPSSRCPPPALATANRRCRPTAPILALLCPPPALLLFISRPLPSRIVVVGAREGRGGMPPVRSLFHRSDQQKPVRRRWHAVFISVRAGGGGGVGRHRHPSPRRRFCHR